MKLRTRIERLEEKKGVGKLPKLTIAFFDSVVDGTISDDEFALCSIDPSFSGFIAKIGLSMLRGESGVWDGDFALSGEVEQGRNECGLRDCIVLRYPSRAPLPDHVHCFDALQRPPRRQK